MTGRCGRGDLKALEQPEDGDAQHEHRGLAVFGLLELAGWSPKAQLLHGQIEQVLGLLKRLAYHVEAPVQIETHADLL